MPCHEKPTIALLFAFIDNVRSRIAEAIHVVWDSSIKRAKFLACDTLSRLNFVQGELEYFGSRRQS